MLHCVYPNMNPKKPTEGELISYLDSDQLENLLAQLADEPAILAELAQVQDLDTFLRRQLGGMAIPDPQDLVDVVAGQATDAQKLVVAAYVRNSARGQRELAALEAEVAQTEPPVKSGHFKLPRFWAQPLAFGTGLRGTIETSSQHSFQVTEVQAQVTLYIEPPVDDVWQITGYVTQNFAPVVHASVTLAAAQQATAEQALPLQETDAGGFFTFPTLAAGTYQMQVHLAQSIIIVDNIELSAHE